MENKYQLTINKFIKMKKVLIALVALSTILVSCNGEKKEKVAVKEEVKVEEVLAINNVDLASSIMTWKGTKPTGAHDGTIAFKESSLVLDNGKIIGILGNKNGPLVKKVNAFIDASVEIEADPLGIVPTASFTVAAALGDALAGANQFV